MNTKVLEQNNMQRKKNIWRKIAYIVTYTEMAETKMKKKIINIF